MAALASGLKPAPADSPETDAHTIAFLWHLVMMERSRARLFVLLTAALASGGCFQLATTINVKGNGSGTLNQTLLFTAAAIEQFRGLALLGGGNGRNFDPISEEQARAAAATLGPGVTYVSSKPINTGQGQGRDIIYGFTDINQLRLSEAPSLLGGARIRAQGLTNAEPVSFIFTRQPL